MPTIKLKVATVEDIASILLLCAPKNILDDYGLLNEDIDQFIEFFNELKSYYQVEIFAEALYYANNSVQYITGVYEIIQELYISPIVLKSVIQFTKNIEFSECDGIYTTLANEKQLKPSDKSRENATDFWDYYRDKYDNFIIGGMDSCIAINEIKKLIITGVLWPRSKPKKGACPNRTTLSRQLVTNRK